MRWGSGFFRLWLAGNIIALAIWAVASWFSYTSTYHSWVNYSSFLIFNIEKGEIELSHDYNLRRAVEKAVAAKDSRFESVILEIGDQEIVLFHSQSVAEKSIKDAGEFISRKIEVEKSEKIKDIKDRLVNILIASIILILLGVLISWVLKGFRRA